jgi:hypothetical protein
MSTSKIGFEPDGVYIGKSGSNIAFLGNTPVAQKSVNSIVAAVDPTTSSSALVASVHSIAVYAASQVNKVVQALQSYGLLA